jgi:hypothetical protein
LAKAGFASAKGADGVRKRKNVAESPKGGEKSNLDAIALMFLVTVPELVKRG